MKKILGLDLGTNSIGWAVVNEEQINDSNVLTGIDCAGSRIIPMSAEILGNFDKGNSISQTAERTRLRGIRRLIARKQLRRERLHRILMSIGWLPEHYSVCLDRYGNILRDKEPKLAWEKDCAGNYKFLFMESYNEMLEIFRSEHPETMKSGLKIPYDWTIYYLRKKALSRALSKNELAWLLLNFNQKRGYYQLRGEEEIESQTKKEEYYSLRVKNVVPDESPKNEKTWYNIILENDWIYRRQFNEKPDWIGKTKDFIVTTEYDKNGNPKTGNDGVIKRSLRSPKEDDWTLLKKKTEADIDDSLKTVGEYIFDAIKSNPEQKIKGKLVRTIERKYYKDELMKILECQKRFHPELTDKVIYKKCLDLLYTNEAHKANIKDKNLIYLFINDIIFYQRPLKSKKSLIANCQYEKRVYKNKITGEKSTFPVKCIAKSNPLFQEFRLWQFISNLRIYESDYGKNIDVTCKLLPDYDTYAKLFEYLGSKKSIDMKYLLSFPAFGIKKNIDKYRWNYPEDKKYPGNETVCDIINGLKKCRITADSFDTATMNRLWHILYSINDVDELKKALEKFSLNHNISNRDQFVEIFSKFPPYKKDYGAYSEKAIKKLLPLMRCGKYWSENKITDDVKDRIVKIINGEYDPKIHDRVREKAINLKSISDFQGLPVWLACYIVYGRHSEISDIEIWKTPDDIDRYLSSFKQHSLHNPIVEQIILETLRIVRDIWKQVGQIDEIHIELGREMKNPAEKRKKITEQINKNEITNLRIKALLTEFLNPEFGIENVRPTSPSQQEILKIYEENVLENINIEDDERANEIAEILKKFDNSDISKWPTAAEIMRYKLWLDQKYVSPYTGKPIPLSRLFTNDYQIEHIIPQAVYFDDSLSNKVICEAEVNKLKDKLLAHQFISEKGGSIVSLAFGKTTKILDISQYEELVKKNYSHNKNKLRKLMMDDIPEDFISRQLNDSRYISKFVKLLLSNIVREEGEQEATSKHVITCTGGITDRLKKDWGVNSVWNDIILTRFQRLEDLYGKKFTATNNNGKIIPHMPLEFQKGFSRKRIDHRHHAMDAIVIACASRNIVNYLNNESASKKAAIKRYDLQRIVCDKKKTDDSGNYSWSIKIPWNTFNADVKKSLDDIIISFKQNLRIIKNKVKRDFIIFRRIKS